MHYVGAEVSHSYPYGRNASEMRGKEVDDHLPCSESLHKGFKLYGTLRGSKTFIIQSHDGYEGFWGFP